MVQNISEKMKEFDNELLKQLSSYGFKKKKKHLFIRNQEECLQHITILETKIKGEDKVYINICVGFKYEKINRLISIIQNEKYDNRWATANINMSSLMNLSEPYGFYLDEKTDLELIIQQVFYAIKNYALAYFESCDTLEKYEAMLLCKDDNVIKSTYTLKRPEWNLLALAIILERNNIEEIFEEYENDFNASTFPSRNIKDQVKKILKNKEEGICWEEI